MFRDLHCHSILDGGGGGGGQGHINSRGFHLIKSSHLSHIHAESSENLWCEGFLN